METTTFIRGLREGLGLNRREFSEHTGIPIRTLEDWEAGRRTPPEYIPRLISYQLELEKLQKAATQREAEQESERKSEKANISADRKKKVEMFKDIDGNQIVFLNDLRLKGQKVVEPELVKEILKEYGLEDKDLKAAVPIYNEENELKHYEIV